MCHTFPLLEVEGGNGNNRGSPTLMCDKSGAILSDITDDLSSFSSKKAIILTTSGLFNATGKKESGKNSVLST